jgi:hypothetical protein
MSRYNIDMARGWESKSVEEQQAEARSTSSSSRQKPRTPEEIVKQRQNDALRLSRSRMVQQLESAANPNYRKTLEAALADLDRRLAAQNDSKV